MIISEGDIRKIVRDELKREYLLEADEKESKPIRPGVLDLNDRVSTKPKGGLYANVVAILNNNNVLIVPEKKDAAGFKGIYDHAKERHVSQIKDTSLDSTVLKKAIEKKRVYHATPQSLYLTRESGVLADVIETTDWSKIVQDSLAVLGMTPIGGNVLDAISASLFLGEAPPKIFSALISIIAIVPGVGQVIRSFDTGGSQAALFISQELVPYADEVADLVDELAKNIPIIAKYQEKLDDALAKLLKTKDKEVPLNTVIARRKSPEVKKAKEFVDKKGKKA
tara:strand:+ start:247 stop:1089 length:843 start_codon:yes stop_codon:yes gene_type:complete